MNAPHDRKIRSLVLPGLGILGGIVAVVYPLGYKAFCAGLSGVVI